MEENTNPQNQTQQQLKPVQKDGLLPGQKEEDELNLLGNIIFKLAGLWISKLKNLLHK